MAGPMDNNGNVEWLGCLPWVVNEINARQYFRDYAGLC